MNLSFFKLKTPQMMTWEKVREEILSAIEQEENGVAVIKPFEYDSKYKVKVQIDPNYSVLSINGVKHYFIRETGEFDGTSFDMAES